MRASGHGRLKHVTKEPEAKGRARSESPCALANAVVAYHLMVAYQGPSSGSRCRIQSIIENSNLIPSAATAAAAAAVSTSEIFYNPFANGL